MVFDAKSRTAKRKNENQNAGNITKATKAKKEDVKVNELNIQIVDLQGKYDILLNENEKNVELIQKLKGQLKKFETSSKLKVESASSQTDFSCFSASCVKNVDTTCDFDQDFNCVECDFEASCKEELSWHMNANHGWPPPSDDSEEEYDKQYICNFCGEVLDTKKSLMYHRKEMHVEEVILCSFFVEGHCDFENDTCWYIHDKKKAKLQEFKCNFCEKTFKTKYKKMHHKKEYHPESVPECKNFKNGTCRFENNKCWYQHDKDSAYKQIETNSIQTNDNNKDIIKRLFDMMEVFSEKIKILEASIENIK